MSDTPTVRSSQLPPVPRTITGLELAQLVRNPDTAALAAVEMAKGRLIVTPLTMHQSLKATGCDPFEFWRLYGLKPSRRPALQLGDANLNKVSARRRKPTLAAD
jgi:hypothetical protein